jgi:hypothetical protein
MKHKIFSLSVLAIALIMSSCSKDIDEGQTPGVNSSGQAIKFKAWTNKQTRAATQAADMTDFAVLATDTSAVTKVLIDGAVVSGSNAAGWSYAPHAYWPETDTVNFFAYAPAAAPGITNTGISALEGQNNANADEPTIEYELPTLLSNQKDLLVSRHFGTYAREGTSGVLLNFRHALSRVKFQAKSESGTTFVVLSIKLKNVKSKATLDLNKVSKDATAFPYPTDNATIVSPGYQIHWVPDNPTTPAVVDLTANLTNDSVPGGGGWVNIVGDDDALYVIPQENTASSMDSATLVTTAKPDPAPGEFYIEITYKDDLQTNAEAKTYAVPVPAIVGDAYKSSIAFEMERQYTFRFELSGRKLIEFKEVTVSNYDEVDPDELPMSVQWAGSNIYWDGTKLTFDDDSIKTNEARQGVFFKWGSLVGISPAGADGSGWTGRTYFPTNPGIDATWTTNTTTYSDYVKIPYVSGDPGSYLRTDAYLTEITNIPDSVAAYKGDICVYLTNIGAAPKGKRWRMPTAAEFGKATEYTRIPEIGGFTLVTNQTESAPIPSGYRKTDSNRPYFPATGYRSAGILMLVGQSGYHWSSSPSSATNSFYLYITGTSVFPAYNYINRTYGLSVRCVVQ